MDKAPDGSVIHESSSDEEITPPVGGAEKILENVVTETQAVVWVPIPHKECTPCSPESPSPIDQLVAASHDAGFNTNPRCCGCHRLDPDTDSDDDGRKPKVKIPPPVFKGLPGERPDAHLLATADWMEAM